MATQPFKKVAKVSMLQSAHNLINGDRQNDYGDKLTNFSQIAMLWTATLGNKLSANITPEDVVLCMMQVKVARLAKSPAHADSLLDIAGYAGCYDAIKEERATIELSGMIVDAGSDK